MASIFPFRALRPTPDSAARVAAVPYDVVNTEEARALASGNSVSFLHVSRAEIDLPVGTDVHSDQVYDKAVKTLKRSRGKRPSWWRTFRARMFTGSRMGGHLQTGIAACYSIAEHESDVIKKHQYPAGQRGRPDASHAGPSCSDRAGLSHLPRVVYGGCDRRSCHVEPAVV